MNELLKQANCHELNFHFVGVLPTWAFFADVARILFASWWLFIQVITSFYTAELTAVLTLSQEGLPVNNLAELQSLKGATWIAIDGAELTLLRQVCMFSRQNLR